MTKHIEGHTVILKQYHIIIYFYILVLTFEISNITPESTENVHLGSIIGEMGRAFWRMKSGAEEDKEVIE